VGFNIAVVTYLSKSLASLNVVCDQWQLKFVAAVTRKVVCSNCHVC